MMIPPKVVWTETRPDCMFPALCRDSLCLYGSPRVRHDAPNATCLAARSVPLGLCRGELAAEPVDRHQGRVGRAAGRDLKSAVSDRVGRPPKSGGVQPGIPGNGRAGGYARAANPG